MASQKPLFETVKPIRVTVPVTPETHAAFVRLAAAQGGSVGKAMGDWLRDTIRGAESMADILHEVKSKPFEVATRLNGYAMAVSDMSASLVDDIRQRSKGEGVEGAPSLGKAPRPPSARNVVKKGLTPPVGNTGGKVSGAKAPKSSK